MENGKYVNNWSYLPLDEFTTRKDMSFSERDQLICATLDYKRPLSKREIMYTLPEYAKPFCIRVIIPKIETVRNGILPFSDEYKSEFNKLYYGYGDRHPKIKSNEKIIIIGSTEVDEISGKVVDIFYGVRECDIDLYYKEVLRALKEGYTQDTMPNNDAVAQYGVTRDIPFYSENYCIEKSPNKNRYLGSPSEFELEYYEDYKEEFEKSDGVLERFSSETRSKYFKLYDNKYESDLNRGKGY